MSNLEAELADCKKTTAYLQSHNGQLERENSDLMTFKQQQLAREKQPQPRDLGRENSDLMAFKQQQLAREKQPQPRDFSQNPVATSQGGKTVSDTQKAAFLQMLNAKMSRGEALSPQELQALHLLEGKFGQGDANQGVGAVKQVAPGENFNLNRDPGQFRRDAQSPFRTDTGMRAPENVGQQQYRGQLPGNGFGYQRQQQQQQQQQQQWLPQNQQLPEQAEQEEVKELELEDQEPAQQEVGKVGEQEREEDGVDEGEEDEGVDEQAFDPDEVNRAAPPEGGEREDGGRQYDYKPGEDDGEEA